MIVTGRGDAALATCALFNTKTKKMLEKIVSDKYVDYNQFSKENIKKN
jgi:hypothetical protein